MPPASAKPEFKKHARAVAYATHCLGVHETPNGSNRGSVQVTHPDGGVTFFEQHDFVAGDSYPWCAAFWLTCWAEAGLPFPYRSPSAHGLGNWARKHGWATTVDKLVPGDGCDWAIGAGHFSLFERYDAKARLVHTIDGNWENRVMRVAHPVSQLRTAVHVPERAVPPPVPEPFWVIATSANGHRQLLFTRFATEATVLKLLPALLARYGRSGVTITRGKPRK